MSFYQAFNAFYLFNDFKGGGLPHPSPLNGNSKYDCAVINFKFLYIRPLPNNNAINRGITIDLNNLLVPVWIEWLNVFAI